MIAKSKILIFGIFAVTFGIYIWINQGGYLYGQPIPLIVGPALIVFGLINIVFGFLRSNKTTITECICPECEKTIEIIGECKISSCSACGIVLEPLEGFYERHPEKK